VLELLVLRQNEVLVNASLISRKCSTLPIIAQEVVVTALVVVIFIRVRFRAQGKPTVLFLRNLFACVLVHCLGVARRKGLCSQQSIHNSVINRNLLIGQTCDWNDLHMFMLLASTGDWPRVEEHKSLIKSLQGHQSRFKVVKGQLGLLALGLFRNHEHMVLASGVLVENQAMFLCQVLLDADSALERLQKDV